ncbi:hypothetical protein PARHAE_02807 [Paracoccus haematequi]|uniref:Uncharacterized protein n=2 Tax=Paracoccus haematequi TaxID=2491866 RepID=A0A3S4GS59_9RHOB|nr:hypothetical protein PARHAE_02807 [Paracoccus haematequi]
MVPTPKAALMLAIVLAGGPAIAQMDEEQLCVNQCMFHHGPASSPAYAACVARQCSGGGSEAPAQDRAVAPRWITHSAGGAHSAAIHLGDRSLNYICQRGGKALIGVAGLGGSAQGTRISVDGRAYSQSFIAQNGILYTTADSGSPLLRALMSGSGVEVASAGRRAGFPLTGSRAAIAQAAAACGIRP